MPPLFTNVINNNNMSFSTISEPNFDWFTHFGGDNNALSDFTPNILILKSPYKRRKLATFIWELACDPLPYKAIRDNKN